MEPVGDDAKTVSTDCESLLLERYHHSGAAAPPIGGLIYTFVKIAL